LGAAIKDVFIGDSGKEELLDKDMGNLIKNADSVFEAPSIYEVSKGHKHSADKEQDKLFH